MIQESLDRVLKIENGFKEIEAEAARMGETHDLASILTISKELLSHEACQVRSLALFLLGNIAAKENYALEIIREQARKDEDWRVQEIAAKAFDKFCHDTGYESALPIIEDWLKDPHPNVCRAVTEGLRIWTGRPYFNTHPDIAIHLISRHRTNESDYLRKSVGNALRDISKKFPDLVEKEVAGWDLNDKREAFTYRFVNKRNMLKQALNPKKPG
jgi:hypothetical protein